MASGKIQGGVPSIVSLGNGTSGVTHYGYVIKDPTTKTCRLFVVARSDSNISTSTILAVVPSGYRPKTDVSVFGVVYTATGGVNAYYGAVLTNGSIYQSAGSTIREALLVGEYFCE